MTESYIIQIITGAYTYIDKATGEKMQSHSLYRLWSDNMIEKLERQDNRWKWVLVEDSFERKRGDNYAR